MPHRNTSLIKQNAAFGGNPAATGDDDQASGKDQPEALEDEEHRYYGTQLDRLAQSHPRFEFANLDATPALSSPPMRTCDNSQYASRSQGDPRNAEGILYPVPFYRPDGSFNGIISVIVRSNLF